MTLEYEGKVRMPRQVVNEGQEHGYVGEKEGLVEVYDPPATGSTNVTPDPEVAERRVEAAKAALAESERVLKQSHAAEKSADRGADKQRGQGADKQRAAGDNK